LGKEITFDQSGVLSHASGIGPFTVLFRRSEERRGEGKALAPFLHTIIFLKNRQVKGGNVNWTMGQKPLQKTTAVGSDHACAWVGRKLVSRKGEGSNGRGKELLAIPG